MRSHGGVAALDALFESFFPKPQKVVRHNHCTKCGGHHTEPTKWCSTCKEIARVSRLEWRAGQKAKGLCVTCLGRMAPHSRARCPHHLQINNAQVQAIKADQRAKGLCAWGRCPIPTEAHFCEKHAQANAEHTRTWLAKVAARRRSPQGRRRG